MFTILLLLVQQCIYQCIYQCTSVSCGQKQAWTQPQAGGLNLKASLGTRHLKFYWSTHWPHVSHKNGAVHGRMVCAHCNYFYTIYGSLGPSSTPDITSLCSRLYHVIFQSWHVLVMSLHIYSHIIVTYWSCAVYNFSALLQTTTHLRQPILVNIDQYW